jgi:hypothetical protein
MGGAPAANTAVVPLRVTARQGINQASDRIPKAVVRHHEPADQGAAGGAEGLSGGDQAVGESAFVRSDPLTQKLRIARVGDALADGE